MLIFRLSIKKEIIRIHISQNKVKFTKTKMLITYFVNENNLVQ